MRAPVLFALLGSTAVAVALVHYLALTYFLYWQYVWLDIFMHFFGGATIGMLFLAILAFLPRFQSWNTFARALLFVLIVGIVWECFEIGAGISIHEPGFIADTAIDLVMDLIGGAVGYYIGTRVAVL